ncbi:M23 family metallopeptidase [Streptomyces sp. NPDC056600]|uniref:M23 family metallopeptidase n=1 Tax=Streptomyces sp. NPDC056600 TaxID=3345874 RepID=UPI0036A2B016
MPMPMPLAPVALSLPFTGLWRVENSPARRVPSHGTDLFGSRYAIDFTGVDDRHRTAHHLGWRALLATERPESFHSFGRPILAPAASTVVMTHDGEPDHEARRSQPALIAYAVRQAGRVRQGIPAVAGNHVVIALPERGLFVALVHFRRGTLRVTPGQEIAEGQQLAECGNSGNSTQPHVHVHVMDATDLSIARGVPFVFRRFSEWTAGPHRPAQVRERAVPGERSVVGPG